FEGSRNLTIDERFWNFRHRILIIGRKIDPEILLVLNIRRDAKLLLRLVVVRSAPRAIFRRRQVIVLDGPVHELRYGRVILLHPEIGWHESQACAEPMRCAACDAIVSAAERPWALLNQIALFRISPVVARQ